MQTSRAEGSETDVLFRASGSQKQVGGAGEEGEEWSSKVIQFEIYQMLNSHNLNIQNREF